jgi:hypothetical protein
VALKSDAAAEKSKDQLSRDFPGRSIFDFFKNISHEETFNRVASESWCPPRYPNAGEAFPNYALKRVRCLRIIVSDRRPLFRIMRQAIAA